MRLDIQSCLVCLLQSQMPLARKIRNAKIFLEPNHAQHARSDHSLVFWAMWVAYYSRQVFATHHVLPLHCCAALHLCIFEKVPQSSRRWVFPKEVNYILNFPLSHNVYLLWYSALRCYRLYPSGSPFRCILSKRFFRLGANRFITASSQGHSDKYLLMATPRYVGMLGMIARFWTVFRNVLFLALVKSGMFGSYHINTIGEVWNSGVSPTFSHFCWTVSHILDTCAERAVHDLADT